VETSLTGTPVRRSAISSALTGLCCKSAISVYYGSLTCIALLHRHVRMWWRHRAPPTLAASRDQSGAALNIKWVGVRLSNNNRQPAVAVFGRRSLTAKLFLLILSLSLRVNLSVNLYAFGLNFYQTS